VKERERERERERDNRVSTQNFMLPIPNSSFCVIFEAMIVISDSSLTGSNDLGAATAEHFQISSL
jgi:hypothetical protein